MMRDGRSRHVHQREEVGIGKQLAEREQRAFAAAHAGEPVVNQRDLHPSTPRLDRSGTLSTSVGAPSLV